MQVAADGDQAFALMADARPDLVILDLMMWPDLRDAVPAGTPLRIAFHIPGEGSAFSLHGRVQWTRPAGVNAAGDPVHSHGIVFEKFAPEVRERLAEMLRPS